ncbi:FIST signal transduction protein [candidate division KSB1 bacterium]
MFLVGIGHSDDVDSGDAIAEVLDKCRETLGEKTPQAGILFSAIDHDHDLVLKKINESYPGVELIGCTTDGELSSVMGFTEDAISLTLIYSDELEIKAGVADKVSELSDDLFKKSVEEAKAQFEHEPSLCIVTPSSLTVNVSIVLRTLRQAFGENFPIFGGSAADQLKFVGTYQFYKDKVLSDAVPFLLFSGPLLYSFGVQSGKIPFGEKAEVTRSEGNTLYTIGDMTAVEFYRNYIGNMELGSLVDYPLAVFEGGVSDFYVRASFQAEEETGSITFFGEIPTGAQVQITHADRDKIIESANTSYHQAIDNYPGKKPSLLICFSCAGRKQILGTRTSEEYELMHNETPGLPITGFYTYGEISPIQRDLSSRFHNETFVSLLLGVD